VNKLQLAMNAGARAIENNHKLEGVTYVYDVYADDEEKISYREAAVILRETASSGGWIPVSERLPDKYGLYIVSVYYSDWICDYGTEDASYKQPESVVLMAEYLKSMNGNHKWILHEVDGELTINGNEKVVNDFDYWSTYVKAWQPLPETYKER
jgi:hypothetical protein